VAAIGVASMLVALMGRRRRKEPLVDESAENTTNSTLHVLYGSQTGTGESFARELAHEAAGDYGLIVQGAESVDTISDYGKFFQKVEQTSIVVLFLSTYGEGDASDDAVRFDEYLSCLAEKNSEDKPAPLGHVRYAIFGLGNTQYALFNAMAKRTDRNLRALGARRICETGFGDDNEDIEADFEEWKGKFFWPKCLQEFGITLNGRDNVRNPREKILINVKLAPKRSQLPFDATVHSSGGDVHSKAFFASSIVPVTAVIPLVENRGKVQVDVDISKVPSLRYRAGDTLEIIPPNRSQDVDWLLGVYGLDGETFMTFTRKKDIGKLTVKKPFPTPCTVRQAVTRYVDLRSRPSRSLIRDIAVLVGKDGDKAVEEILSRVGVFTVRNLLETYFENFSSHIEFGELIQLLPKQKARAYSICSSPLVDSKKISLVVSRVDDDSLTSVYLCDTVAVNETMNVSLRQGTMRLPTLPGQPVIMISVGTGFAPFRAFLVELKLRNRIASDKTFLFFGCRRKSEWIYRQEMEDFQALGGKLHVAFSREVAGKVEYVQHILEKELTSIDELINRKNAIVYVCGSTGMGLAVMDVIAKIASINDLRTEKRYVEELWG
jgi:NADPH-ferrihemoprotein reductase